MSVLKRLAWVLPVFAMLALTASHTLADPIPEKYQDHISKGLEWLKKTQGKDGSWSANGQNPIAMTALAGLAMLMEGSTVTQGKYAAEIRKSADFLMARSMKGNRDGLIGNPDHPGEAGRYMYGHGFAMLFLGSVYGEEEDKDRREKLKDILTRAVKYCGGAQSTQGGWFYTSKADGQHDSDEGSVTVTQMQGMRACRDAGIAVPKEIMKKGYEYLRKSTTPDGGVVYSLGRGGMGAPAGGGRPALTAAAIACLFSAGEYKDENVKKWFKFCQRQIPMTGPGGARFGHDEYTHFYLAPSIYFLGEEGWEKMFPGTPKDQAMTWSKYRTQFCDSVIRNQGGDGSWGGNGGWSVGPVYSTSVYLVILQLDNNCLPVFQR